jgi:hypothetical protein
MLISLGKVCVSPCRVTVTLDTTCPVNPVTMMVDGYRPAMAGGFVLPGMEMLLLLENESWAVQATGNASSKRRRQPAGRLIETRFMPPPS